MLVSTVVGQQDCTGFTTLVSPDIGQEIASAFSNYVLRLLRRRKILDRKPSGRYPWRLR
jgi:hypothetical protein